MVWIASIVVAVIGVIIYEVRVAPEVSDDYEIELWEKYRQEERDEALPLNEKSLRHSDAA